MRVGSAVRLLKGDLPSASMRPRTSEKDRVHAFSDRTRMRVRSFASDSTASAPPDGGGARKEKPMPAKLKQKVLDRDFFMSVFSANATKRDAKAYLSRYKQSERDAHLTAPAKALRRSEKEQKNRLNRSGVNLGGLYGQARAIDENPVFSQQRSPDEYALDKTGSLHIAIVKVRGLEDWDAETMKGVSLTFAQLARLGLLSCVVVDGHASQSDPAWKQATLKMCFKLANAIRAHSRTGARVVDQILSVREPETQEQASTDVQGRIHVGMSEYLISTLKRGLVPIIAPVAYTSKHVVEKIDADEAMLALTREFAGPGSSSNTPKPKLNATLDKIIVLDPLGGLPSAKSADQGHIFVNLESEYDNVRTETLQLEHALESQQPIDERGLGLEKSDLHQHVKNLDLIQGCLKLLPPSSSALLTTPIEVANSALSKFTASEAGPAATPGVGTRVKKNPLIHNLLTDKPVVSSSLPADRLLHPHQDTSAEQSRGSYTPSTFFKRGMPLTVIPDPRTSPWTPPGPKGTTLTLDTDPRIDFPRLLHLIEDSFGRPLDVQHYLSRVKGRVAGVIIAGDYEGGAILTWETPPISDPSAQTSRIPLPVPYLDKFAVLRRSQGSGGVADIVFNAMVRTCLPDGVIWRSRRDNPVNKWYFERSAGTWKLPGSQWCMFWTGRGVDFGLKKGGELRAGVQPAGSAGEEEQRWMDYVAVCAGIQASWADGHRRPPD